MKTLALIVLSGLAASVANAQTFSLLGTPVALPDNNIPGLTINTGAVAGTNATIDTVFVTMDWSGRSVTGAPLPGHTWIGDVIATLTYTPTVGAPVSLSLMNRVGAATPGAGDSSDLSGVYIFANGGANLWSAAAAVPDGVVIAPGTYSASGTGSGAALDMNATFAGLGSTGTWSLFLSDNAFNDLGFVASASVTITTIPTPAAAALLGLGGLVAARRRRA